MLSMQMTWTQALLTVMASLFQYKTLFSVGSKKDFWVISHAARSGSVTGTLGHFLHISSSPSAINVSPHILRALKGTKKATRSKTHQQGGWTTIQISFCYEYGRIPNSLLEELLKRSQAQSSQALWPLQLDFPLHHSGLHSEYCTAWRTALTDTQIQFSSSHHRRTLDKNITF